MLFERKQKEQAVTFFEVIDQPEQHQSDGQAINLVGSSTQVEEKLPLVMFEKVYIETVKIQQAAKPDGSREIILPVTCGQSMKVKLVNSMSVFHVEPQEKVEKVVEKIEKVVEGTPVKQMPVTSSVTHDVEYEVTDFKFKIKQNPNKQLSNMNM